MTEYLLNGTGRKDIKEIRHAYSSCKPKSMIRPSVYEMSSTQNITHHKSVYSVPIK